MSSPRGDTLGLHPGHELGKTGTPHSKPPLKPKPVIPPHLKNLLAHSESHNTSKSISPTEDSAPMSPPPDIPSAAKLTQLTGPLPYGARRPSLRRWTSIGEKEPSPESPVSPLESPIMSVTSKNVTNIIPTLPKPQFTGTGWKGKSPFFLTSRGWGENWRQSKDIPDSPPSDPSSKQNSTSIDETSESADTVFSQKELVPVSSELKKEALLSETEEVLQQERQLHQSPKGTFPVSDSPSKWDITESKAKTLESAKPSTMQEGNVIASTDIYETSVRVEKELPKDELDLHQSPKESPESIFNMGLTAAGFDSPSTRITLTTVEKPDQSQSLGKGLTAIENLSPGVTRENQGFTEFKAELSDTESGDEATASYECAKIKFSEQPVSGSFPKYMSEYAYLKEGQDHIEPSVVPEESLSFMHKHQTINKEIPELGLQFGDNAVEEHKQEKHVEWKRHDKEYTDITITQQSQHRFMEPMDGEDVQALPLYTKEDYGAQHLPSAHVEIPNVSFAGSDLLAPPEMFEQGHQQDVINIVSPTKETLQYQELRDLHPSTAAVTDYFKPSLITNISTNEAMAEVRDRKSDINKAEEIMDNENKVEEPDTLFKGPDLDHGSNYALFTLSGESVEAESSNDVIEQRMDTKTKKESVHETYNEKSSAEFPSYMNEYKYRQPTNDSEYEAVDYTAILDEVQKSNRGAIPHTEEYTEEDTKNIEYNACVNAEDVYFVNKDKDYVGHKYIESVCLNEKIQEDLPGQHDSNREIDEPDDSGRYSLSYVDRYATQSYVMPSEDSKMLEFTQEQNVCESHVMSKNLSSRSTPSPSPLADDNFGITPDAGENFTEELYNSNARFAQIEKPDDTDTKPDIPYMKYVEYETNVEEKLYKEMPNVKFQQENIHEFTHIKEPLDRSPESENSPYSSLKTEDIESKKSKQLEKNQNIYSTEVMDCGAGENQLRYTELATNTDLHYDQQRPQVSFSDLEETYPDNIADVSELQPHKFLESENLSQTETDERDLWYKNTQSELFPQSDIQLDQPQDTYMKLAILDYESVATQDKTAQSGEVKFLNVSEGQVGLPELDGSESQNTQYQESMRHNIQSHVVEHRNISPTFQPIDHQSQEDYHKKDWSQELGFGDYQPQEVEPRNDTLQKIVQNDSNSEVEQHIDNQLNKIPYLDHHDHQSQKEQYKDYESQEVQFNENLLQEEDPEETKPQDLQYAREVHQLDNHDLKHDDTKLQEPQHIDDESDELEDHHSEELQSKEESQRDPEWSHQLNTESEELQQRETDLEDSKNETQPLETETDSESEGLSPLDFTFLEGTEVLDTSLMRCRASLGKKRCHRAPPQLPCSNEEKDDPEYWMFRDSTETSSPTKEPDSEEKECSPSTVSPVTSPGKSPAKKGGIFAGIMNPSLLKGRLKIRSKHAGDEAAKKEPEEQNLSPKSSNPPEKDGHSLNWLSALKKKKKSK